MSQKRPGQPLTAFQSKKVKTEGPGSGFSYSGLQKLKQQKEAMKAKILQQQQKSQQSSSSSSQQQQQQQQKQDSNKQESNKQNDQQSKIDEQKKQQKLAAQTSQLQQLEKKMRSKLLQSSLGAKPLPQAGKAPITKKQDPNVIDKLQQPEKKVESSKYQNQPKDYNSLKKYAMKKALAEKKLEHKIKTKQIVIDDPKKKEEEEAKVDPKLKDVKMTESGELRDESGKLVKMDQYGGSLKINKIKKQQDKYKQLLKNAQNQAGSCKFVFDGNLSVNTSKLRDKRKSNAFHFMEKGSENVEADEMQKQIQDGSIIERKEEEDQQVENYQTQQKRVSIKVKHHDPIPNIEWWDKPFLFSNSNTYIERQEDKKEGEQPTLISQKKQLFNDPEQHMKNIDKIDALDFKEGIYNEEKLHIFVEHPAQFKNNQANQQSVVIPFYLTKKERKKIRRKKRLAREQLKQDEIKLGLIEPPKPKAKLSNMVNIYGNQAFLDPSKVEQEVRQQVLERLQAHNERQLAKKLTPEQRKQKFLRKLKRDSAIESKVALFRVENLSDGQHRYKVDANAIQMQLNGICLIGDYIKGWSLVLVEGGPKAVKFYKNLMLRRIKWQFSTGQRQNEEDEEEDDEQEDGEKNKDKMEEEGQEENSKKKRNYASENNQDLSGNKCALVWEGTVKEHNFNKWKVLELATEMEGKKALAERGVEYYWDLCENYKENE